MKIGDRYLVAYSATGGGLGGGHAGRVLTSVADSTPTLARYNLQSDNCKWKFVRK